MNSRKDNFQIISRERPGIYIHIPFCRRKCLYCDFFSAGSSAAQWDDFSATLLNELRIRKNELTSSPSSIYIGGGTPSLMPIGNLVEILDGITMEIDIDPERVEFTMEVNPEDVSPSSAMAWKEIGINRVSMGVQSFIDSELKRIGRRHSAEGAAKAFKVLRQFFSNISLDLMFGLPGQTMESWEQTIDTALSLNPDHISAYSLMLEEKTPMTVLHAQGKLALPDDVANESMWMRLAERLKQRGFNQYEISNYARPGFESIHNSKYWRQIPYLGLGPSAHSYDGYYIRRSNPNRLSEWLDFYSSRNADTQIQSSNFYIEERLNDDELAEEFILTRLRTVEGIEIEEYGRRFGEDEARRLLHNAERILPMGGIGMEEGRIFLSSSGLMVSDDIMVELSV